MLLRRVKEHVTNQDWSAVAVDFVIVVIGVYIGIEFSNWNEFREDREKYHRALNRLHVEANSNLELLKDATKEAEERLDVVNSGLKALLSCQNTPENLAVIEKSLDIIGAAWTIHVQTDTLEEITTSPRILTHQPSEFRQSLKDIRFELGVLKTEADFSESLPFKDRPESNPILKIGGVKESRWNYQGLEFSQTNQFLTLAVPVDKACENDQLIKSYYRWLRFQSYIPVFSRSMHLQFEKISDLAKQHKEI